MGAGSAVGQGTPRTSQGPRPWEGPAGTKQDQPRPREPARAKGRPRGEWRREGPGGGRAWRRKRPWSPSPLTAGLRTFYSPPVPRHRHHSEPGCPGPRVREAGEPGRHAASPGKPRGARIPPLPAGPALSLWACLCCPVLRGTGETARGQRTGLPPPHRRPIVTGDRCSGGTVLLGHHDCPPGAPRLPGSPVSVQRGAAWVWQRKRPWPAVPVRR